MFKANDQIKVETQKAIDVAMDLVTTSIHSIEKLTHIQLETSRQMLAETTQAIKELAGITDPKELMARVNTMASQAVEKNVASARDVFDVVSEVQAKLSQVTEGNVQNLQQAALDSVDGMAKYNPTGAEAASGSLKTWIKNSNQALDALNKVASQVNEFANSSINNAATATVKATKKASAK
ncbi:MAG: phasin family protein [Burkholderiales bacterium]|nr:phasin family protein [Burkholderiales bacterium]MBX9865551.1 phasin family protein [Burkholderiales bacterium]